MSSGSILALTVVLVVVASPPLRGALVALEPVLAPCLFLVGMGGAAFSWVQRWRGDRHRLRDGRGAGSVGTGFLEACGGPLAVLAFLAPLLGQWERGPVGASAAYSALLGHLPFGDAQGHLEGAARLLNAGELNGFSERRPLNATLLAVLLGVGRGSLPFALVAQAALLGVATWWAARVVSVRFGVFPSLAFFGIVLGLLRGYVISALTEPLAATFACLAVAILLSAATRGSLGRLVLGFVCLDAALRTRPGAQFLLPFLIAWAVYAASGRRARTAAALAAVAIAGVLHTGLLNGLHGSGEASATSYPAYTFYGLARGTNYEQASKDFGPQLARLPNEDARAGFLRARALEALARDPGPFLRALVRNESELLSKLPRELARIMSAGAFATTPGDYLRAGSAALLFVAAGFVVHFRSSRPRERLFWVAVAGGLLSSAPFVLGDTGLRAMTAGLPIVALGVACGLAARRRRPAIGRGRQLEQSTAVWAGAAGVTILVVCVVGPPIARAGARRPDLAALRGLAADRNAVVEIASCPAVLVSNRGRSSLALPLIDGRELDERLTLAGVTAEELVRVPLPTVFLSCYDHLSTHQLLLVAPHNLVKRAGTFLRLGLQPLAGDDRFQEVRDATPVP